MNTDSFVRFAALFGLAFSATLQLLAQGEPEPAEETAETTPQYSRNAVGMAIFRILTDHPEFVPYDGNLVISPASLPVM